MKNSTLTGILQLFESRLPIKPRCANSDAKHYQQPLLKYRAKKCELIEFNRPFDVQAIGVDIDHNEAGAAWIDNDAPAPNIICINPKTGRGHYLYVLNTPVLRCGPEKGKKGRQKPWQTYREVTKRLTRTLGGDAAYNQLLIKNPFSPSWVIRVVREEPYTLRELGEKLPADSVCELRESGEGRNVTLFDTLRKWAYKNVARQRRTHDNYVQWITNVQHEAEALNAQFGQPLPRSEVRSVTKSVARYSWERAFQFSESAIGGQRRAAIPRDEREEITKEEAHERILEGQKYAAHSRSKNNQRKIEAAVSLLASQGKKITQVAVARISGLCVRTVRQYKHLLSTQQASLPLHPTGVNPDSSLTSSFSPVVSPVQKIAQAVSDLHDFQQVASTKKVAELTGVSLRTVQRHKHLLSPPKRKVFKTA